uniref:Uncharacterized protein n=1 Tax=Anguilla anguilla TaxID=7936 RepID=A0A0E9T825_ANGAN
MAPHSILFHDVTKSLLLCQRKHIWTIVNRNCGKCTKLNILTSSSFRSFGIHTR